MKNKTCANVGEDGKAVTELRAKQIDKRNLLAGVNLRRQSNRIPNDEHADEFRKIGRGRELATLGAKGRERPRSLRAHVA